MKKPAPKTRKPAAKPRRTAKAGKLPARLDRAAPESDPAVAEADARVLAAEARWKEAQAERKLMLASGRTVPRISTLVQRQDSPERVLIRYEIFESPRGYCGPTNDHNRRTLADLEPDVRAGNPYALGDATRIVCDLAAAPPWYEEMVRAVLIREVNRPHGRGRHARQPTQLKQDLLDATRYEFVQRALDAGHRLPDAKRIAWEQLSETPAGTADVSGIGRAYRNVLRLKAPGRYYFGGWLLSNQDEASRRPGENDAERAERWRKTEERVRLPHRRENRRAK